MTLRADVLDISHHNAITKWSDVPDVPIVHKVNEGTAVDRRFETRMPKIKERNPLYGGYTVLIVSQSTIRQQVENYARLMEPFWGEGAFTQLDVEPWKQYDRPVNADEIDEARDHHKRLLGRAAFVYINPNQMPKVFREWRDRNPKAALWLPNYSKNGAAKAEELGAEIHQHTDKYPSPGFKLGIDANEVRDWACVRRMAGVSAN